MRDAPKNKKSLKSAPNPDSTRVFSDTVGTKSYEFSNHLGNVLVTLSDKKMRTGAYYSALVAQAGFYYPFGWEIPTLQYSSGYRYGFNGKENDSETKSQDYGFRLYFPRVSRFFSVDPIASQYPELTTYQFASNTPIQAIDLDGLEMIKANDLNELGGNGMSAGHFASSGGATGKGLEELPEAIAWAAIGFIPVVKAGRVVGWAGHGLYLGGKALVGMGSSTFYAAPYMSPIQNLAQAGQLAAGTMTGISILRSISGLALTRKGITFASSGKSFRGGTFIFYGLTEASFGVAGTIQGTRLLFGLDSKQPYNLKNLNLFLQTTRAMNNIGSLSGLTLERFGARNIWDIDYKTSLGIAVPGSMGLAEKNIGSLAITSLKIYGNYGTDIGNASRGARMKSMGLETLEGAAEEMYQIGNFFGIWDTSFVEGVEKAKESYTKNKALGKAIHDFLKK